MVPGLLCMSYCMLSVANVYWEYLNQRLPIILAYLKEMIQPGFVGLYFVFHLKPFQFCFSALKVCGTLLHIGGKKFLNFAVNYLGTS